MLLRFEFFRAFWFYKSRKLDKALSITRKGYLLYTTRSFHSQSSPESGIFYTPRKFATTKFDNGFCCW